MPRRALHTSDVKIDQSPVIDLAKVDTSPDRAPEIIKTEGGAMNTDYLDELAFNEEPVTIVIEQNSEKNSPGAYYVANNGKGAEVLENGRWFERKWLPVNQQLTIKRKCVAILLGAKTTRVETVVPNAGDSDMDKFPGGKLMRFTSGVCSFSIIEDRNPKGAEWAMRLRRQNF